MIDPAFWQSESVATLPIEVRYFFIGLFSNADDQGRMKAHPALLRSKLYPYDDIKLDDITDWIVQLVGQGSVIAYTRDGKEYIQIANWWRYQRPRWAWPSTYPAPEGWADRVHYRKGNQVLTENWDESGTDEDSPVVESEPTMEPEWNHSEPTVEPAPSTRISISTRISTSDSTSNNNGDGDEKTDVAAVAAVLAGFGMSSPETVAQEALGYYTEEVEDLIGYARAEKLGPGWVRTELRAGHRAPPKSVVDPDDHEDYKRRMIEAAHRYGIRVGGIDDVDEEEV